MKRKHFWLPCGVKDEPFAEWSQEDKDALLRQTDWQKWITDAMWRDLMEGNGGPNISKLKRRVAEWIVVVWRLQSLKSEIVEEAYKEAGVLWERFWAIQAFGREGLHGDHSLDDSFKALSKGRKEEGE